jgi:hypothetical protein
MLQAVVQSAEPLVNSPGEDHHTDEAVETRAEGSASGKRVLCIQPPAPVAEKKLPFPFSHVRIVPCTVAIATSRARLSARIVAARAGEHTAPDSLKLQRPLCYNAETV